MSFTERVEKLGKDLGGAALAPFKLVWDIGTSPFNDNEEFNGVANTLKTSFGNFGKSLARPIGDVLSNIDAINRTVVREPLTNLLLNNYLRQQQDVGYFFDDEEWKKKWEQRNEVSFGQALALNLFGDALIRRAEPSLNSEFDIFNEDQRNQVFKESLFGKLTSGSFDFAIQVFGDVTLVGGKAVKVAKASEYGINALKNNSDLVNKAVNEIKAAQEGFKLGNDNVNKYSQAIKDFTQNGVDYALARDLVKSSDDPTTLAYLLGKSNTEEQTGLVLRMALGDKDALLQFEKTRPSQAYAFKNSTGQVTETKRAAVNPPVLADNTIVHVDDNPNVIDEVKREYDDLVQNDEYFQKFVNLGRDAEGNIIAKPILRRTVGASNVQKFEDFLAKGRTAKFYDRRIGEPIEEVYQPTKFHRAYKRITWAADERPGGHIDLNDPDSYQEFSAAVTRALKVLGNPKYDDKGKLISGMSGDEARAYLDNFVAAAGPEQRAVVVYALERDITQRVAAKYGIDIKKADDLYTTFRGKRQSSVQKFKELGFGIDESGQMLKVPILESQTINSLPVMDFDILNTALSREESILKSGLSFKDGIIDFVDVLQDLFKAGTLLRLGYTMRNAVDSQLRIAASFGPLYALKFAPQGFKNFIENAGPRGKRMIDNFESLAKTRQTKFTRVKKLQKDLAEQGRFLDMARKQLAKTSNDLEQFQKGPTIPPFKDKDWSEEEFKAIKFGNEETLKRVTSKPAYRETLYNDPYIVKQAEDAWTQSLPGGDQVKGIENLITNKIDLARFKKTGIFPAYILRKFFKKDKYGNPVKLPKNDPLSNYTIEDIQDILFPDLQGIGRIEIGPGEIEQRISNITKSGKGGIDIEWYPSVAKKDKFIDEYRTNYVNENSDPQRIKEYLLLKEEQHNANYLQKFPESDVELVATKQTLETTVKELEEKFEVLNNQLDILERGPAIKRLGQDTFTVASRFADDNYVLADAFGSKYADLYRQKVSNASTYENLAASNPKYIASRVENEGFGTVTPNDVYYYEEWARVLNNQFGNSDVVKLIAGKYLANGDWLQTKKIAKNWLANSREGRRLRAKLSPKAFVKDQDLSNALPGLGLSKGEVSNYIDNVVNMLKQYAPGTPDNVLLQRLSKGDIVTTKEMRSWFPNPDVNPNIHGRLISENLTNNIGQTLNNAINSAFQVLGTLPEDSWARFPLYINLYRKELTERIGLMEGIKKGALTAAEQEAAMRAAHTFALRQVNRTLFTIVRRSNMGASTFIRLISPFFSAQENAMKTWARIIGNNPAILNRGQLLWTAPNRAGLVTDQEGNEIPQENLTRDGVIWVEVPKPLQKLKGLSSLNQMGISKNSLDIVFGGGFEIPVGPYVAIPASEIVKRKPELEDSLKWAIPFGPERNAINALLPTWLKRQIVKVQGQNNPEYARAYQLIWTTEQHKAREEGRPYLTPTEIQKKVDAYYNMRSIANLVLPFAPRFDTPYRMYMDKWREYQRTFGKDADEQFLADFGPEFFDFAMSLSQNVGGVQASVDATLAIRENKDLVADLYAVEPSLIGLVVNNPSGYDFSQAAYEWEYATPITPGSKQTFRGTADPADVAQRNQAKLGWIQYRQFMSTEIEPVLVARGLSSIRDRRARDLRALRDEMITKLANENTAWYDDYLDTDGSKTNRVIRGLQRILSDEKFMAANADNPTWKSLMAYLTIRNEVAKELSQRKVKTLGAKANIQLALAFDAAVGRLKQDDIGFSDIYDRFLSNDPVYDKYLTESEI